MTPVTCELCGRTILVMLLVDHLADEHDIDVEDELDAVIAEKQEGSS